MENMRNAFKILLPKAEELELLWRPRHKREDNIKEKGCYVVNWIQQLRIRIHWGSCEKYNVPSGSIKYGEFVN
jgi:hypothetical protein